VDLIGLTLVQGCPTVPGLVTELRPVPEIPHLSSLVPYDRELRYGRLPIEAYSAAYRAHCAHTSWILLMSCITLLAHC
jgi:hypothetical protein